MRICLLTTQDLDADPFPDDDWPCDPRPFLPDATWDVVVLRKPTAVRKVIALAREGYDLFFNLCDGAWDEDSPGIEVVQTMEQLGVPFTGSSSEFFEPSREAMKRVCRSWGIDTPAYVIARNASDVEVAAETLRFPQIVKHPSSYASIGLTQASRVETPRALGRQARRMIRAFGGALIEEFIEGTECTVLVAENPDPPHDPTTYQPIQYLFPEGETFKHSDVKWVDYGGMDTAPVRDRQLDAHLRDLSARLFVGLNGASFGRCDFRVTEDGRPFLLEINANCGVYYPPADAGGADLCLAADPAGHAGFTRQIVAAALSRHALLDRGWAVRLRPEGEYGLVATRTFARGRPVVRFEDQNLEVLTKVHVDRCWGTARRAWFARHAWPLADDLWAVPNRDPEKWAPMRHACNPSARLRGRNVVARRGLRPGDEITLDHATCRGTIMPPFECHCGAKECRGVIRGAAGS